MTVKRWTPHVTVATVVERLNERKKEYLFVREQLGEKPVLNQPAGHLEAGESLIGAAVRETLEETAWLVEVTHFLGIYRYLAPNGVTYLRHGFAATCLEYFPDRTLDKQIIATQWLSYEEIIRHKSLLRSPLVLYALNDFRSGLRYSLDILRHS